MRVAMATYRPRRYLGGPIMFVRATITQVDHGDPLSVWQGIAKCGLMIRTFDGVHTDLIVEPNLALVADALMRALGAV
jgi:acetoacetyl-CoA synthetase